MLRLPRLPVMVLLCVACADGSSGDRDRAVVTVDGVSGRTLVSNPDVPQVAGSEPWELTELWRVGALAGEGPDVFGEIRSVELGPDGSLLVLDGQASDIRAFGPDGAFRRRIGGPGGGPGELSRPLGMTLDGDGTLWVLNWGNGRYTGYDAVGGGLIREVRRQVAFASVPWPGRFDESGRLVEVGLDAARQPAILRLDTAFAPSDTLPMPREPDDDRVTFRRDGMPVMSMPDPFSPRPFWGPARTGIVIGDAGAYRLHRVTFDGDTTQTVEIGRPPAPVTPEERDSALAVYREMAESSGGAPDRPPRVADVKPVHGSLFVDDRDRIWVYAQSGGLPVWDVIDPDGIFMGQIVVPEAPGLTLPRVRAGRLALVGQPSGVPTVVLYALPDWLD